MGISDNSGFQELPKVGVADIINFQVGANLLQTSFAKAFQEPDTESVVIANLHHPVQPSETQASNVRMLKNAEKKRASLNQQIRDIIQRSIRRKKSSEDRKKEKEMLTINHNFAANKQDREERIRDEKIQRKRVFDENMKTPSYISSLEKELINESVKKGGKSSESAPSKEISQISEEESVYSPTFETEFSEPETEFLEDEVEFLEDEKIQDHKEELETRKDSSQSEASLPVRSQEQTGVENHIPPPLPTFTIIPPSSSISPQRIMSLPSDLFELFQEIVGAIVFEQGTSGITNMTVTIHRPGSVLDKSEVLLQFFDTNPRSCNVELRGTTEAVRYFHQYHTEFTDTLQQSKLLLDINVRRPSLLPNKKIVKRKTG